MASAARAGARTTMQIPGLVRWRSLAGALLLAFGVAACAGAVRIDGERQVSLPEPPRRAEPASQQNAQQREHQRILGAYGGAYSNPRLEAYVAEIVDKLTAASERPDLRYRVTLLNSPAINAFALPSGQLYVTRGLVGLANDRAELASVLAHEMAHVIARHAAIREDQARQAVLVSRVLADVLDDPDAGAMSLARSRLALASFSRAQELEADGVGIGISARAGFDPYGAVRFLTTMGRFSSLRGGGSGGGARGGQADFMSTHPSTPERIRNALANARQHGSPGTVSADRAGFLAAVSGLTYGDDPSEGFVRGRRFLHPRLGFTVTAPDGFALENTSQALLGLRDNGSEAMRLDSVQLPAGRDLADYMRSGWIDNIQADTIQTLTINGASAAVGLARGEQWTFRVYAIRFGNDVYRLIFATRNFSEAQDASFRESAQTFRRLEPAEIQAARPLRIEVVTAQAGDTPERLAQRMSPSERGVERFLVLNGLEQGQALRAGDPVKVVVE
jgi:predicted Zn-dependent protease